MPAAARGVVAGHEDEAGAIKSQTERGRTRGQQRQGPECNNISEANVLFVDVVFGNLSAIFLAAAVSLLLSTRSFSLSHSLSDSFCYSLTH